MNRSNFLRRKNQSVSAVLLLLGSGENRVALFPRPCQTPDRGWWQPPSRSGIVVKDPISFDRVVLALSSAFLLLADTARVVAIGRAGRSFARGPSVTETTRADVLRRIGGLG
jgi:hypothetical protein